MLWVQNTPAFTRYEKHGKGSWGGVMQEALGLCGEGTRRATKPAWSQRLAGQHRTEVLPLLRDSAWEQTAEEKLTQSSLVALSCFSFFYFQMYLVSINSKDRFWSLRHVLVHHLCDECPLLGSSPPGSLHQTPKISEDKYHLTGDRAQPPPCLLTENLHVIPTSDSRSWCW